MDRIQELLAGCYRGNHAACNSVFRLLRQEVAPRVARLLRKPLDSPETEEILSDVITHLMFSEKGEPPPGLARDGKDPTQWRLKAARNKVYSLFRSRRIRREIERLGGSGMSVAEVSAERARRRRERELEVNNEHANPEDLSASGLVEIQRAQPLPDPRAAAEAMAAGIDVRNALRMYLPAIAVRRRVALALECRMSAWTWLEEFATANAETYATVAVRLEAHEDDPQVDELRIRVIFPEGDLPKNKNAFRKLVTNAFDDLRNFMSGGRSA